VRALLYIGLMCAPALAVQYSRSGDQTGSALAAVTMIASLVVFVVLLFAALSRWYHAVASAPLGAPTSLAGAQAIARRQRGVALIAVAASVAAVLVSAWSIVVVLWVPVFAVPVAWRAERAAAADAATLHERYVHLWRGGKLRAWLRVRPHQLAALGLPRAQVKS
jgi:hypothetical protein